MHHRSQQTPEDLYAEIESLRKRNEALERLAASLRSDNERLELELTRLASSVLEVTRPARL